MPAVPQFAFRKMVVPATAMAIAVAAVVFQFPGGCAATLPDVRQEVAGADWVNGIVAADRQIVFAGGGTTLTVAREPDAVRLTIHPVLWPTPRLVLLADTPAGPPVEFLPQWSRLAYTTVGKPYRIELTYPSQSWRGATTQPMSPDECGTITYFMADRTQKDVFHGGMVAFYSPMHLLLIALGPLPQGQTRLLAVRKSGKDYWATIDAYPDGRRVLRFPDALLWGDWSDTNLAKECVFEVESVDHWPDTTIHAVGFTRSGPITVKFQRIEAASD